MNLSLLFAVFLTYLVGNTLCKSIATSEGTHAPSVTTTKTHTKSATVAVKSHASDAAKSPKDKLPPTEAMSEAELKKKVVDLKKQAARIMVLRGKNVSVDVNATDGSADWGDIKMDRNLYFRLKKSFDVEEKLLTSKKNETDRMAIPDFSRLAPTLKWTPPIKYTTHLMKDNETKVAYIERALKEITDAAPCITFEKAKEEPVGEQHIEFQLVGAGLGCASSPFGKAETKNTIEINSNCDAYGTMLHETLHSLGFGHTHTRPDRDQYVTVHEGNIQSGAEFNFKKWPSGVTDNVPYDYYSILHYHTTAFSDPNDDKHPTITIKDEKNVDLKRVGQRDGLSADDKKMLKKIYCDDKPETAKCFDNSWGCFEWKDKGNCEPESQYYRGTIERCQYTCGKCDKETENTVDE